LERNHRLAHKRAIEHLYALHGVIERWADDDPCTVREECEVKTRKHSVFLDVDSEPDATEIALIIGECVHGFRRALDHLAYELAIRVTGSDPPPNEDTTGFPVCRSKSHLDGCLPVKIGKRKEMPEALYTALERLQPYHGGPRELLTFIEELDNRDKHRFPALVAGVGAVPNFHIEHAHLSYFAGPRIGPIEPGTPVVEYTPMPDEDVAMNFEFAPTITFAKGSPVAAGMPVLQVLINMRHFLRREVFPPLEPFL
jgi:hypothetical protein